MCVASDRFAYPMSFFYRNRLAYFWMVGTVVLFYIDGNPYCFNIGVWNVFLQRHSCTFFEMHTIYMLEKYPRIPQYNNVYARICFGSFVYRIGVVFHNPCNSVFFCAMKMIYTANTAQNTTSGEKTLKNISRCAERGLAFWPSDFWRRQCFLYSRQSEQWKFRKIRALRKPPKKPRWTQKIRGTGKAAARIKEREKKSRFLNCPV